MWEIKSLGFCLLGASIVLATDPCDLEFDAGPCRGVKNVIAFDKSSGKCVPKVWGGCRGNTNRFSSIKECEDTCSSKLTSKFSVPNPICSKEPLVSRKACMGIFPRFTFNAGEGKCEEYTYGGCGGSENLFITEAECIDRCMKTTEDATKEEAPEFWSKDNKNGGDSNDIAFVEDADDICSLPPIWPGPMGCMALMKKWTFSKKDGSCIPYTYGGCRGTPNLFDSKTDCEAACKSKSSLHRSADVCSLPLSAGPCKAMKPSFGFNKDTGRCEAFIYGGCKGNGNNFPSIEECVDTCGGSEPAQSSHLTECSRVECDEKEAQVQRAKGCVPTTKQGECCPSSWDCSVWEKRLAKKDMCFYSSVEDPVGKFYAVGESIPEVSKINSCRQACFCSQHGGGNAHIMCASVDCAYSPKFSWDTCRPQYDDLNQCCMPGFACGEELNKLSTCSLDGKTYYEGQKMYPEKDKCAVCHCMAGWDGDIQGEFCRKVDCGLQLSGDKLMRGCQPVYQDNVCCPTDWVCPNKEPTSTEQTRSAMKASDRCLLPKDIGPCKMFSPPTYYFDTTTRKCQKMNYGGCKGNENRFGTEEECEDTCKEYMVNVGRSNSVPDTDFATKCEQDKAPGKCRGFQKKYFHNKNAKKCQEFVYTGCQGNENNYDSLDECEATCGVVTDVALKAGKDPKCNEPVLVGKCRSRLEKYYYDQNTGLCKTFYYSGCRGGSNMFDSINECVQTCVQPEQLKRASLPQDLYVADPCQQEKVVGPCRAKKSRWFFNKQSQNCEPFEYSGCRGNDNNFETQLDCQAKCQPIPNARSTQINISPFDLPFTTLPERVPDRPALGGPSGGGCPGCASSTPITPDIKMVAAHGSKKLAGYSQITGDDCDHVQLREILHVKTQVVAGTNYIFSMMFDIKEGPNCETKTKRTCRNIYIHKPLSCRTKEDLKTCLEVIRENGIKCDEEDSLVIPEISLSSSEQVDPCMEEKAVGRCKASFPRYYFDKDTKSCKPFNYGGCMGNGNNFADQSSCEEVCSKHLGQNDRIPRQETRLRPTPKNEICKLAMDAGPCFALMPRFYFNFATRRCEEFLYGGCKGNANNFKTMQECISGCGKHPRSAPFPPLPPPLPQCKFGNNSYNIGDIVRLDGDNCKSCICSSPPDLTCTVKACTMRAFFEPRGGVNCVMQKDDFGCCDIGYKCDSVTPQSPGLGGGYPVLGGYNSGSEPVGPEVKKLAAKATKTLLTTVAGVTGDECSHATLLDILEVKRQVVAGTNFKLKLKLRTKSGSDCSNEIEKVCENIVIFRPLKVHCLPTPDNPECLEVTNQERISCS